MNEFIQIPTDAAHRLINHGPTVLVSTRDEEGSFNLAPIAWNCPVGKDPPTLLIVVGKGHKTNENIEKTGEFIVCVPHRDQTELVVKTGKISGYEVDKFSQFSIDAQPGEKVNALVPVDSVGYSECRVKKVVELDKVNIVIASVEQAWAKKGTFKERLLIEKEEAKTIHHLGGHLFSVPGSEIVEL
jgi:flavin reductase (DIM6/NTAB) family NADH-FMN oxidoreductase RutF